MVETLAYIFHKLYTSGGLLGTALIIFLLFKWLKDRKMSDGRIFTIITVYDDEGYVSHFDWEIRTRAAIIRNKVPIKSDKNTCYNSLVLHTRNFLGINLKQRVVRNKTEGKLNEKDQKARQKQKKDQKAQSRD